MNKRIVVSPKILRELFDHGFGCRLKWNCYRRVSLMKNARSK